MYIYTCHIYVPLANPTTPPPRCLPTLSPCTLQVCTELVGHSWVTLWRVLAHVHLICTPLIHTSHSYLICTPPIPTSYSHLAFTPPLAYRRSAPSSRATHGVRLTKSHLPCTPHIHRQFIIQRAHELHGEYEY